MTSEGSITRLFGYLADHRSRRIERHEISSLKFGGLRRNLRLTAVLLAEEGDDEGKQLSDAFRRLLSKLLTSPAEFDETIPAAIETIGKSGRLETRWGPQIGTAYNAALAEARDLVGTPNPLRRKLMEILADLAAEQEDFRIYCHRSARGDFVLPDGESGDPLQDTRHFLHTLREYREADVFGALVKVGPLRAKGWGAVPDAILTAPRFGRLIQFVWNGCHDEPEFGYDPVAAAASGFGPVGHVSGASWRTEFIRTDDISTAGSGSDEDDLRLISLAGEERRNLGSVLLALDHDLGILFPPRADVLSFDPAAAGEEDGSIAHRSAVDGLSAGMFLIEVPARESSGGATYAEEGEYSRIWKQRLLDELFFGAGLLGRLRKAGIDLIHLENSVRNWAEPTTSVVHAPQKRKHFEILIRHLDIEQLEPSSGSSSRIPWWMAAWREITRTRSQAIQNGIQEHRVAEEKILESLSARLPEIVEKAGKGRTFHLPFPNANCSQDMIAFHRILAVDEGFFAPAGILRVIHEIEEVEQWRE
ncbi:MAG: hypothetical protein KF712_19725 [Akkermansiaceae bacterium]|nr:hypothetical protein [Akkermansiaceae bacterium]